MPHLPRLKKKYFHHGVGLTPESRAALVSIAANLKWHRKQIKLTQAELAAKVGCSMMMIYHVEKAHNFPSLPVYLSICRVLKLPRAPLT